MPPKLRVRKIAVAHLIGLHHFGWGYDRLMLPIDRFPDSRFTDLGYFQVTSSIAIGEGFEFVVDDAGGNWAARWIDTPTSDQIYRELEDAGEDANAHCCQQLQVFLDDIDPSELAGKEKPLCELPIHGANFRVGDSSLQAFMKQHGPLSPLFDGVEGLIGGAGVSVYLGGDGRAEVHVVQDEFGPQLIHINLR